MKNQKLYIVDYIKEDSYQTCFSEYFTDIHSIYKDLDSRWQYLSVDDEYSSNDLILFDIHRNAFSEWSYMPKAIKIEEITKHDKK